MYSLIQQPDRAKHWPSQDPGLDRPKNSQLCPISSEAPEFTIMNLEFLPSRARQVPLEPESQILENEAPGISLDYNAFKVFDVFHSI